MELKYMFRGLIFLSLSLSANICACQNLQPSIWEVQYSKSNFIKNDTITLYLIGKIPENQGVYSTKFNCAFGPQKTKLHFKNSGKDFLLIDSAISIGDSMVFDDIFECNLRKFKTIAVIKQVLLIKNTQTQISGFLEYQTCNNDQCLKYLFNFKTKGSKVIKLKN